MNWKTKAIVQRCLSRCPFGIQANYLLQRYVSKSLPIDYHTIRQIAGLAAMHLEQVVRKARSEVVQISEVDVGERHTIAPDVYLAASG